LQRNLAVKLQRNDTQLACNGEIMALIGLKRAAELTGKNQSTIHRAMKANRLAFTVSDDGERLIDPSELHRVFPILANAVHESTDASDVPRNNTQLIELRSELEIERVKNTALRDRLAAVEADKSDLQEDRNRWRMQAEQSQLFLADLREKTKPVEPIPPSRSWWGLAAVLVLGAVAAAWWVLTHPQLPP
jgi:hypothetical protein